MHSMRHPVLDMIIHRIDLDQSSENNLINFDREVIRFDLVVTLHLKHVYCIMTLGHYYILLLIFAIQLECECIFEEVIESERYDIGVEELSIQKR
ncbi:MAG: hypothetical protein EZS28_053407, partial [Streblomastix strix]